MHFRLGLWVLWLLFLWIIDEIVAGAIAHLTNLLRLKWTHSHLYLDNIALFLQRLIWRWLRVLTRDKVYVQPWLLLSVVIITIVVYWVNSGADGSLTTDNIVLEIWNILFQELLLPVTVRAVGVPLVEMGAWLAKAIVHALALCPMLQDWAFTNNCYSGLTILTVRFAAVFFRLVSALVSGLLGISYGFIATDP